MALAASPFGAVTDDAATTCGSGRIFLGELVSFADRIDFTIRLNDGNGYLLDCFAGVDAYFEYQYESDGSYVYAAWGQLGQYG